MRQIGSISDSSLAERFADHLRAAGIACTVDTGADGYRVWVHDDDRVAEARDELPGFLAEPNNEKYRDATRRAMARARQDAARLKSARARTVVLSDKWAKPAGENSPVTYVLIALSIFVGVISNLKPHPNDPIIGLLWFTNDGTLQAILHGEFWRLITPIFLHIGMMHLAFNMIMFFQFGMPIENRLGSAKFLGMVLVIAVFSNVVQFWFSNPQFGGMSGVVYGLFGYIWIKGKLDPESGFLMPQQTVTALLVWFVLCIVVTNLHAANWAHGGGLAAGMSIACLGTMLKPLLRRK